MAAGESAGASHDAWLRTLASFGANVTVLTALLIYFGWKRADTHARVLGIDESVLRMSSRDYLLRSVDALFVPIGVAASAALAWLFVDAAIRRRLVREGPWRSLGPAARVLRYGWLALPLLAVAVGLFWPPVAVFAFPLSFGAGALTTAYGVHLSRALRPGREPGGEIPAWHGGLTKGMLALVVALSGFWAVTNYAAVRGLALGSRPPTSLPALLVYSAERLALDAPGVVEERLEGRDVAYRFRYRGLRLLQHSDGRYFLLSDGWTPRYGVVILLDEDDRVRFEFVRDRRPGAAAGELTREGP